MRKDRKLQDLAGIPLFAEVDRRELDRIAQSSTQVRVTTGQALCRQGRLARQLVLVEAGHAAVLVDGRQVDVLARGDFFGETAVLGSQRYAATVIASTPMLVLTFTRPELSSVLPAAPTVAARMLRAVAGRRSAAVPVPGQAVGVPAQRSHRGARQARA